jgi:hypothetical protein
MSYRQVKLSFGGSSEQVNVGKRKHWISARSQTQIMRNRSLFKSERHAVLRGIESLSGNLVIEWGLRKQNLSL